MHDKCTKGRLIQNRVQTRANRLFCNECSSVSMVVTRHNGRNLALNGRSMAISPSFACKKSKIWQDGCVLATATKHLDEQVHDVTGMYCRAMLLKQTFLTQSETDTVMMMLKTKEKHRRLSTKDSCKISQASCRHVIPAARVLSCCMMTSGWCFL